MEVEERSNSSNLDLYVNEKKFSPEQNCGTSRNKVRVANKTPNKKVFLTRIVITKDDISRYLDIEFDGSNYSVRKPIFVDIYI